jgi:hypothetical protein
MYGMFTTTVSISKDLSKESRVELTFGINIQRGVKVDANTGHKY